MKLIAKLCLVIVIVSSTLLLVPQGEAVTLGCCLTCRTQLQGCYKNCGLNPSCEGNCDSNYESCVAGCALQGKYCS